MPLSNQTRTIPCVAMVLLLIVAADQAAAQRRRAGRVPNRSAIVERPAEIENLLKRAADGRSRQDWKLVVDSLQRVIDDPAGGLVEVADDADRSVVYYRSARDRAMRMLAELPPVGIESYRVLHDGRSRSMFEAAMHSADIDQLRDVVDRYFFTTVGPDAALELAGWYLDLGNDVAALELIGRIERTASSRAAADWRLLATKTVALAGVGASQEAEQTLDAAERSAIGEDAARSIAAVRRALSTGALSAAHETTVDHWPMRGGGPRRSGVMSEVSPELREGLPWRYALPSDDADWWETQGITAARERLSFPVADAVIDGGRVFVKSNDQIAAMDLESLEPLWVTDQPVNLGRHRDILPLRNFNVFGRVGSTVMRGMTATDRRLYDVVGQTVTTAFGKVYSIEREGVGRSDLARAPVRVGVLEGTRLVALNQTDGFIAWQRGRTGDKADPLNGVYFLSPPIAVGDALWVPLSRGGDIYLARLSPEDGRLLGQRLLCSVERAQIAGQYHEAMYLVCDGHMVYVSTGLGLVIAVDVDGFSLTWATQYPRDVGTRRRTSYEPRFWHCCPPVLAGNRLIVAPVDADALFALDAGSGRLLWKKHRVDGARYIMGADDARVWLGGPGVYCVSVDDGEVLWRSDGDAKSRLKPTGRGAVCGSRVFVPTVTGLAVLSAETGEAIESRPLPADQLALGNLLCAASAMFSVDTNEVRKFPDLTLSYPRQLARFNEHPGDHQAAIRLAWMELLRDAPDQAFAVLDQLPPSPIQSIQQQVARLKVKSLLKMADAPGGDVALSIRNLRDALRLAVVAGADRERLEAAVNLAARLREQGEVREAYLTLWRVGMSEAADGYLTIAPRLRQKARRYLADRMARMDRSLSPRQLKAVADQTHAVLDEARTALSASESAPAAVESLTRLAELNDVGGAGQGALLWLGTSERELGQFERSEQYFKWAIRSGRVARLTALARYELAAQYLHPAQMLYHQARALLDQIDDRFDPVKVGDSGSTLGLEKARLMAMIRSATADGDAVVLPPKRFGFVPGSVTEEYAWMDPPSMGAALLDYGTVRSEALSRSVLTISKPNIIEAFDVNGGALAWRARIALLSDGEVELPELAPTNRSQVFPRIFCDGQTAVLNGPRGLFGIGVATGRRLWGVAYEDDATEAQYALRNRLVAVQDGVVVYAPRRGVLTAASVLDADDILWERIVAGEKLDTVFVRDGLCITLDAARRTARTYNLTDGRRVSAVRFRRGQLDDVVRPLVYEDGMLIGPDGLDRVVAFDVRSGEASWRWSGDGEIRWLFRPGGGVVGLWMLSGDVVLLDAVDGSVVMKTHLADMDHHLADGVLRDDVLVLMPIRRGDRGAIPVLYGVDVSTGQVRWVRDGFDYCGPTRESWWRLLRTADDVVPMAVKRPVESANRFLRSVGNVTLVCIDKKTGRNVGAMVATNRAASDAEHLTGDFALFGNMMVFGTRRGLMAIDVEPR